MTEQTIEQGVMSLARDLQHLKVRHAECRRYSQDLQRIIEYLCVHGALMPEEELQTSARHHWNMAKKFIESPGR